MKICLEDPLYGIYPPELAYRPDEEIGAIESEGPWIWDRGKANEEQAPAQAERE